MPSPIETFVKILKLEREQGCNNRAVIGGLSKFSTTWKEQAQSQARRPEHYLLAEEATDLLANYDTIEDVNERARLVTYLIDRALEREPMPSDLAERMSDIQALIDARTESRGQDTQERSNVRGDSGGRPSRRSRSPEDNQQVTQRKSSTKHPRVVNDELLSDEAEYSDYADVDGVPQFSTGTDVPPTPTLVRPPRRPREDMSYETARQRLRALDQPITAVKGIGSSKADMLEKLGIRTIRDMLYYLPRRYDDYTRLKPIRRLEPGEVATVIGMVRRRTVRVGRSNRKDFFMVLEDDTAQLSVIFFGQDYLVRTIQDGQHLVVSGKVSVFQNTLQMANPEWELLDSENLHTIGIVPVYPLTEGVRSRSFRRDMKTVVDAHVDEIPDYMPESTLERADLGDLNWAIRNLHFPQSFDHLQHARRRFVFDELTLLQLGVLRNRREWQSVPGVPLEVNDGFLESFIENAFPYVLTGAQRRAIDDIRRDVSQSVPMNRLIQGDVGSGKTAVATVAIGMALSNTKQAALMAPTSILAEQHYRGISATLEKASLERRPVVALLTSALSSNERSSIYRGIADGSIDVVIGTHALIQDNVEFNDLAVAIVDEQHRFGVAQRGALRGKGTNPHMLVMTATPIPRSLALTLYADLDLTVIDEKPAGRQPVQTYTVLPVARERAFRFVEDQLLQGRQAFIVHPLVESSDKIDARSAVEAYEELQQVFYKHRVCLLHGRMKPQEKDEIMAAFGHHEYDVMVTTTVAEVGVDVPNATVILIEGANRFGLAQLHQLRGRVGRGEHPSTCILIPDTDTPEARARLEALVATDDGFRLAEVDWQQRGAGDLLGTRQSGRDTLQLAQEMTPDLVALAQREARTLYAEDPDLQQPEHRLLAEQMGLQHDAEGDIS